MPVNAAGFDEDTRGDMTAIRHTGIMAADLNHVLGDLKSESASELGCHQD